VNLPASGLLLSTELRANGHGLAANVVFEQMRDEGVAWASRARVNELNASGALGAWQFSAGKKIVGWDVGYGFRPNDLVQQEERRTLLPTTPEGRPLVMAEYFDAETAWSVVWVNPTKPRAQPGAEEPAIAARVYRRAGAVDWFGFARHGAHSGASLGTALAWVASESIEVHASLRRLERADSLALAAGTSGLVRSDPWQPASVRSATQALVGGTWTNAAQLSLLAEAWWDGAALSNAQWDAWLARNGELAGLPAPAAPLAGNLAWQADALGAGQNLRRTNLFARVSWQQGPWQPALDLLVTPADGGRVLTASLGWQGDRARIDAGVRAYGGRAAAVTAQLPTRRLGFVAGTLAF
jgi:hypothetical protein